MVQRGCDWPRITQWGSGAAGTGAASLALGAAGPVAGLGATESPQKRRKPCGMERLSAQVLLLSSSRPGSAHSSLAVRSVMVSVSER